MSYISAPPRNQLMLPYSIDEYVSEDNVVRFIDAFVDKVLEGLPESERKAFQRCKSVEGRPGYTANCLCKLLIYGYLNSISSSRKLEAETKRNLESIWLMNNLQPDYWTISNFRKENRKLIKEITIKFRQFLMDSGYITGKSISTDGTKIKAYASQGLSLKLIEKKLTHAEKEIERYLSLLNDNDALENEQEEMLSTSNALKSQISDLQRKIKELKSQKIMLEKLGLVSLAPSDPEAKLMKTNDGFRHAYNVQMTADNDSHFITSCEVTDYPNDFYALEENVDAVTEQLGIVPEAVVADGGFSNEEQVKALEERGIECIVAFPGEPELQRIRRENGITFTYDQHADCFKCSQGKTLLLVQKNCNKNNRFYNRYQCRECDQCPKKQQCTTSKTGRYIYRRIDGEWLQNYRAKMKTREFKDKYRIRNCVAEHPFATMRYLMGQIPLLLRGKEKVQIEIDLYSTAYNLKRMLNVGVIPDLLEKLAQWLPNPASGGELSLFGLKIRSFSPVFSAAA